MFYSLSSIKNWQLVSLLLLLIFTSGFTGKCDAESRVDLFQRIFGNQTVNKNQSFNVPLLIDNQQHGEVHIIADNSSSTIKLTALDIFNPLKLIMESASLSTMILEAEGKEYLRPEWFTDRGLITVYDREKLILKMEVPTSMRRLLTIHLTQSPASRSVDNAFTPSDFSAYINIFAEKDYLWTRTPAQMSNVTNISFHSALNVKGWVLETSGRYTSYPDSNFLRGDIQLIKDIPLQGIRISSGDVTLPATGFQNALSVGGITIEKMLSIQPNYITSAIGISSFSLEHFSTVEILINGLHYRTLRLPAGRYDLRDFPIASGISDVTIVITDRFGHTRKIEFPLFADSTLLAKDMHEYGYGIGYPTSSLYEYDTDHLIFSGFHRTGISPHLTLGTNFQTYQNTYLLGGEMRLSRIYGNFLVHTVVSRNPGNQYGSAEILGYNYQNRSASGNPMGLWELTAAKFSARFQTPGIPTDENSTSFETSASVSFPWKDIGQLTLRAKVRKSHGIGTAIKSIGVLFNQRISHDMGWDLSFSAAQSNGDSVDYNLSVNFNYRFGKRNHNLAVTYDTAQNARTIKWSQRSPNRTGGIDTELEFHEKPDNSSILGRMSYRGNRAETQIQHIASRNQSSQQQITQSTNIQLATAVVYAGGHFALSRPITDSFVIIAPHVALGDRKVVVDLRGDSFLAESGFMGPAVVPDLASYHPRILSVDIPDLPVGYNIGDGLPHILPTYNSGTVIILGSDANVMLRGKLILGVDKPLSLKSGTIVPLNGSDAEPILFFTNRKGHFQTEGLRPGAYRLQLTSHPESLLMIEIPSNAEGIYDAGTLQLN